MVISSPGLRLARFPSRHFCPLANPAPVTAGGLSCFLDLKLTLTQTQAEVRRAEDRHPFPLPIQFSFAKMQILPSPGLTQG